MASDHQCTSRAMKLFALASLLSLTNAAIWSSDKWEVIHKQSDHHKGHDTHPSIRYGHAAEQLGNNN